MLDVSIAEIGEGIPDTLPEDTPESVRNLQEVLNGLSVRNLQECYNDAIYYRDEMRQMFITGARRCGSARWPTSSSGPS